MERCLPNVRGIPLITCRSCAEGVLDVLADFGPQPLCNRFLNRPDESEYTHFLRLGICESCGVVQLPSPPPAEEVRPRFPWITYNEPEHHLDRLVETIARLPGLTFESVFGGLTFKDDSTLNRMNKLGYSRTWRLDPGEDLGVEFSGAGLETIQDRFDVSRAQSAAQKRGKCHVLFARHILEHVYDLPRFILSLRSIVRPGGYVLFEIPDCQRAFEKLDYSTMWEEYIFYFTPISFKGILARAGLTPDYDHIYPNSLENSLVSIGRFSDRSGPQLSVEAMRKEKQRALSFVQGLESRRKEWRVYLSDHRRKQGPVGLLGAGHLSASFINILKIKDHIDFLVDDNPHKQGMFMPGSGLPILPSAALSERAAKLCLMSVSPENEDKVIEKNRAFLERGGVFKSIFPDSPHGIGRGD